MLRSFGLSEQVDDEQEVSSATLGRYVSIPRGELAMPDYPVPKDAHF
jgi:hypothetical protein